jgi:DNA polymerase III subunit delta'
MAAMSNHSDRGRGESASLPGLDAHPHARAVLTPALPPAGRPSHAYLFHGPSGTGKRAVARAFAGALLADGAPDAQGAHARASRGTHPDLTWVTPSGAAEMLVGDVDEAVVAAAARTPFEATRRVFVLEAAHTLNEQAANRLLKTLEEPPPFAHLLLISDRREDILPTISSRCLHVRFDPLPVAAIAEGLLSQAPAGITSGPELTQPARAEEGAFEESSPEETPVPDGRTPSQDEGSEQERTRAHACARLASGDSGQATVLAGEQGQALRAAAEGYVRSALAGASEERGWSPVLDVARAAGVRAGEDTQERMQRALELAPAKERKRLEREGMEVRRRAERRGRAQTLEQALRLVELWLRDLLCLAEGAGELIHNVDRRTELEQDGAACSAARVRRGIALVQDTRLRLTLNVSEELALEALAFRL